ncbi:receptor-like protein kinase FERONIA [Durio zibethinus]|uniref:Receptor-like protein kinase FERONIA n=1 Tax=Durio zibethinus TaxID=66656 RepID=A0A6P6A529_DURZI|nr:receptor-like protein kinase FERONIA [Durio zibethinus]
MMYHFCSLLGFFKGLKQKKNSTFRQSSALPEDICRQFSLAEIKAATNNFHPDSVIGAGRFWTTYRGTIDDGTMVAVKHCQSRSLDEVRDFRNEVQMLCQLRHPHLVSLIGICLEQNEMLIVLEYMSRRSLANFFNRNLDYVPLAWKHRLRICIGAARGLHYLHTGAKHAVIHRAITSLNILLDDEYSCKLSDFGLSKMGPPSMSKSFKKVESRIVGTYGYMAPEYAMHGELTEKSDVFSFGVILFEVLFGVRVNEWTSPTFKQNILDQAIDPYLKGRIAPECFKKYLEIACSCVHKEGNERPAMGEVEVTLELALELQEKADSELEGLDPHGECMYGELSFCGSVTNLVFGGYPSETDSNNSDENS